MTDPSSADPSDSASSGAAGSGDAPGRPASSSPDDPPIPDDLNYLVIEGVIGAGKTSLARLLADRFSARAVLEEVEENPFLERFYDDPDRWAFSTQLSFLASRFRQQKELAARDLFHDLVISDYSFDRDRIFAHQTLQGDELQLYERLFRLMEPNTPTPDLVVYLRSAPERLLHNIAERDRAYERDIDPDYIRSLHDAYDQYFLNYRASPLLIVNTTHIDFVDRQAHLDALSQQILATDLTGTRHVTLSKEAGTGADGEAASLQETDAPWPDAPPSDARDAGS
jgi:deoxyadenosine/deoxycytidine kinase